MIAVLNDHFISILVDREERPDLDHHFAGVMAAMTGRSERVARGTFTLAHSQNRT